MQLLVLAYVVLSLIAVGVAVIVNLAVKLSLGERDNADLRQRLLTAESIGQTQAVALGTVDALARATRRSRS